MRRSLNLAITCVCLLIPSGWTQENTASTSTASTISSSATTLSREEIQNLIRIAAQKDIENDKRQHNYTYTQHKVEKKLDGAGNVKSTETTTYEVMVLYDEQVKRLIARNDQPLPEKEAQHEEERIQKI